VKEETYRVEGNVYRGRSSMPIFFTLGQCGARSLSLTSSSVCETRAGSLLERGAVVGDVVAPQVPLVLDLLLADLAVQLSAHRVHVQNVLKIYIYK
jgi:hypothetical protein